MKRGGCFGRKVGFRGLLRFRNYRVLRLILVGIPVIAVMLRSTISGISTISLTRISVSKTHKK